MSKLKLYSIFLLVGFICLSLDMHITTGFSYPNPYENSSTVTGEYQYNNIKSNYNASCTYKLVEDDSTAENENASNMYFGSVVIDEVFFENWKIDIFNDFLGFILIFIGCLGFSKSNGKFKIVAFLALIGFVLHGAMVVLPFFLNGLTLCNVALLVGLAYLGCYVLLASMTAAGLYTLIPDISCRDERKWCKLLCIGILAIHGMVTMMYWLGTDHTMLRGLGHFFVLVEVCATIAFALVMKRTSSIMKRNFIE